MLKTLKSGMDTNVEDIKGKYWTLMLKILKRGTGH
jgi:hypothetical protein